MPSPSESGAPGGPAPGSAEEALRRLEQRLDRASEAAERLMAEAAEAAAGAASGARADPSGGQAAGGGPSGGDPGKPPPAGWQIPGDSRAGTAELDPLVTLVQALRDLIPPELQRRLVAAIRELLLALRALIDWYLERLERRREQAVEVQDIPIL
jgi:hypothetical protein